MFQLGHIITATQLVKKFSKISNYLEGNPEPLLIMQKNGKSLVIITAEMFEDLALQKLKMAGIEPPPAYLKDMLKFNS